MKRHIFVVTVVLGLTAWLAFGADISGVWTAQVPGRGGDPQETTFNFKVSGDQLTGSVVTSRGERPIENGKVVGDDVSFTQTMEFGGNQVKLLFKGKVSGSEIKFTRQREGSDAPAREFVAKKKGS